MTTTPRHRSTRARACLQAGEKVVAKWPTYIPWVHGAAREKRFVCDVMLEGLARQMRLFGLDALSMEQRDKKLRSKVLRCGLLPVTRRADRVAVTLILARKSANTLRSGLCKRCMLLTVCINASQLFATIPPSPQMAVCGHTLLQSRRRPVGASFQRSNWILSSMSYNQTSGKPRRAGACCKWASRSRGWCSREMPA